MAETPIQIVIIMACGAGLVRWLGWSWEAACWFGAAVSLSSTMVVLKTLQAQGRLGTLSSRVMIGMLLVQDLAVVPMLVLLPKLGGLQEGMPELGLAAAKAAVFIGLTAVVGLRVVPPLMAAVSRWNSRELFLLAVAALGLGVGYVTWRVGLSFAFGALVAGLVLSESEHSHQALSDIIPLRDLFGLLFFVSVGMLLDPQYLRDNLGAVLGLALVIGLMKGGVFALLSRAFGYGNVVPLAAGLTLFQVGELAFVLARVGVDGGHLDRGNALRLGFLVQLLLQRGGGLFLLALDAAALFIGIGRRRQCHRIIPPGNGPPPGRRTGRTGTARNRRTGAFQGACPCRPPRRGTPRPARPGAGTGWKAPAPRHHRASPPLPARTAPG